MFGTYIIENVGTILQSGDSSLTPQNCFTLGGGYAQAAGRVDEIFIDNARGPMEFRNPPALISVGKLNISGHSNKSTGDNASIQMSNLAIVTMQIDNSDIYGKDTVNTHYLLGNGAGININHLIFNNLKLTKVGATSGFIDPIFVTSAALATIETITFNNATFTGQAYLFNTSGTLYFASAPNVNIVGGSFPLINGGGGPITIGTTDPYNFTLIGGRYAAGVFNMFGSGVQNVRFNGISNNGVAAWINTQSNVNILDGNAYTAPQRVTPTTGQTVTPTNKMGANKLTIAPAGTLAALTLALPANPINGETIELSITQGITVLTITGGTIAGIASGSAIAAGFSRKLRYSQADTLWV